MDYFIIKRTKNNRTEFLHLTPCGKHVWGDKKTATEFTNDKAQKKCKTLRTKGRANYNYSPQWLYYQKDLF